MADRRPLVMVAGVVKELEPPDQVKPDVLPAGGGGTAARSFFLS